jgi:hypothetical protein
MLPGDMIDPTSDAAKTEAAMAMQVERDRQIAEHQSREEELGWPPDVAYLRALAQTKNYEERT